jgi:hypothetical protein
MLKPDVPQWLASLPGQPILFEDHPVSFLGRTGVYGAVGLYLVRRDSTPGYRPPPPQPRADHQQGHPGPRLAGDSPGSRTCLGCGLAEISGPGTSHRNHTVIRPSLTTITRPCDLAYTDCEVEGEIP